MSRSYKKTPSCGFKKQSWSKKWANRKVRHRKLEEVYRNKSYKKLYNELIYDNIRLYFPTFQSYINTVDQFGNRDNATNEDLWKNYIKYYLRK